MTPGNIRTDEVVSLPLGDPGGPVAKARPVPFKPMIGMTKAARRHAQQIVEFRIWRGDHHRRGPDTLENRTLERTEAVSVKMLDRFDKHGTIKSPQPVGDVEQRGA